MDIFFFSTVYKLCMELNKKIELNMWVDNDLNVPLLIETFPKPYHHLIDMVYYRFDHHSGSRQLKKLMTAFECTDIRFQESKDCIKVDDIVPSKCVE